MMPQTTGNDLNLLPKVTAQSTRTKPNVDHERPLINKESVPNHWPENFYIKYLLFRKLQSGTINKKLNSTPTTRETATAIEQLKCGKTVSVEGITPEF